MTEALTIAVTPRARWEKTVEWPLTMAALLFIAAYAVPVLNPDLSDTGLAICRIVERVTWVVFVIDYGGEALPDPGTPSGLGATDMG